ncbi:epimerase [Marinobacterium nitratireducens]|uniref:Epimerase n=1 Tax=Marinobacterium nitratireducens TaxID=518897 RepID=A0A918DSX0_9GAMM|nr:TIGR01777 family oxidoreductase [Marinobacterium nitratireducens]GGO81030.1 epimerase [Marinobacterium nitratireducens]
MKVLITGGTGFIGQALCRSLLEDGCEVLVLTRSVSRAAAKLGGPVRPIEGLGAISRDESIDAIVNLAGAPIVDRRWTDSRKRLLRSSRLDTTQDLLRLIERLDRRPEVLVSGSAVGYYGSQDNDHLLTEESDDFVPGFPHQLCADWEAAALQAEKLGVRVCLLRTGIVLGKGGALAKMLPAFRLGMGGPIASGRQWMAWVQLADEVGIIRYLIEQKTLRGAFNACAPEAATNAEFTRALAKVLKRPAFMRVPEIAMKLLLGEASELLVSGQRAYPRRLLDAGYQFRYTELEQALRASL